MQKSIRINETQLLYLSSKAREENTLQGYLYKKSLDTGKWQMRWFALYQNLLFYYENESCHRPSGMALLEGSFCEKVITPTKPKETLSDKQFCFAIFYRKEGQRQYELRAENEADGQMWMEAISKASKILELKQQVEQKHLHLLQVLDSERQAKWYYVQQTEEFASEVANLKREIREYKEESRASKDSELESEELKKIKKVQSFFRGWLCRRRWKQIVELYIRSEHAESMRKRNNIVFKMVESEEDYVKQLSTLVSVFLRPFRMSASSKVPPVSHDDVNSIFLNSETLLFLHQIFLKGLMARMENWPTIVLDLFDMLLPMLGIYQEYVRNHHYSLQVLAECKQKSTFNQLLQRCEEKPQCEGRSLATFLTYPMHQVPRYIITIHELLAHTPHDHVERKSLEFALGRLEELSQIMQDEVSETENIRKNLAIERMIVEGCDILLDVNQTFVRQGSLVQIVADKNKSTLGRLGPFGTPFKESKKETVRQVYLFTYHLMLTTRASNGRLHLVKNYGKIPLMDCTLIEEPWTDDDDSTSFDSNLSLVSQCSVQPSPSEYNNLDFRILVESRTGPPMTVNLVASTMQEKSAWCSDISQCIENLHYNELLYCTLSDSSSVTLPQSMRCDPKLFKDDIDIKFSRALNSCKVPQIRHASVERLLERLTDLRFLSIDFLNTFLLTYRVFTTGSTVVEALRNVYRNPECGNLDSIHPTNQTTVRQSSDNDDSNESSPLSAEGAPEAYRGHYDLCPQIQQHQFQEQQQQQHRMSVASKQSRRTSLRSEGQKKGVTFEDEPAGKIEFHQAISEVHLLPKPPKLAPIASFETLSESIDLQLDDIVDYREETKFRDDTVVEKHLKEQQPSKANLMPMTSNLPHATSVPEIICADDDGSAESKGIFSPFHNAMSLLDIPDKSMGSSSTLVPSPRSPGREERAGKRKWRPSADDLEPKIIFGDDKSWLEERDNSARNRLIGSIPRPLSPLLASKSHHMKNNLASSPCCERAIASSHDFFFSSSRLDQGIDALALSPLSSPTLNKTVGSFNAQRRPRSTSPSFFDWQESTPSELSERKQPEKVEKSETSFVQRDGVTDSSTSDEGETLGIKTIYEDSRTSGSSTNQHPSRSSLVTLTKSIQQFATQFLPSPSKGDQTKIPARHLESGARRAIESQVPKRKISKTEITAPAFIPVLKQPGPPPLSSSSSSSHPRSSSTSAASGRPTRQTQRSGESHSKRESMPNMPCTIYHPLHHYTTCQAHHRHQRQSLATSVYPRDSRQSSISGKPRAVGKFSITTECDQPALACSLSARSSSCATVPDALAPNAKAGIVVTSSRASKRRSSSTAAAVAFAVATAGSASIKEYTLRSLGLYPGQNAAELKQFVASRKRESVISTFATMRVLNVLRHWVTKHYKDFEMDQKLKEEVNGILEEMMGNSSLLPVEFKIASAVSMALNKEQTQPDPRETLAAILKPPEEMSEDCFESMAALDIAEQMTFLDHKIFISINVEELLGQAWMKPEKMSKAQNVLLVTKRFNEASRLVVSEIIRRETVVERASCIEKWAAIADICRCINNFNGVLQICAAFVNSSIYRLRKTWEKVPKQTKQMIDKLQNLVSADGRFKNMRDALHRCDPPCIPYLGIYLTDLSFIEEGTPNVTDNGLINFSKMRMIAHVIQEIASFQQTPYKIEFQQRVADYLLDPRRLIDDDQTFKFSLQIEPRSIRMSIPGLGLLG